MKTKQVFIYSEDKTLVVPSDKITYLIIEKDDLFDYHQNPNPTYQINAFTNQRRITLAQTNDFETAQKILTDIVEAIALDAPLLYFGERKN